PLGRPGWATQSDALLVLALDEQRGAAIRRIDEMLAGGQGLLDERLLDRLRALRLMDGGCRRMDMRQQVRGRGLAGLTDMHHVPGPLVVPLLAIARIGIIGRFHPLSRWWQVPVGLETHAGHRAFLWRGSRTGSPFVVALPGST